MSRSDDFQDFLQNSFNKPIKHIVVGNEAGDADSIVSALVWAFVKSNLIDDGAATEALTPVVSITKNDIETQRPETKLLLKLAKIPIESLIYVDDPKIRDNDSNPLRVTLVDHNRLTLPLKNAQVIEILDHHADLGAHPEAATRIIAFEQDKATVASTCTLVVEHCHIFPVNVSLLLLGVILLDSINLLPEKATERDQAAVDKLIAQTNWSDLSADAQAVLQLDASDDGKPNTTALFKALQGAKFDPQFWKSLSVRDTLRLDYKRFESSNGASFGSSSVLVSLDDFCEKKNVQQSILEYMDSLKIDWLILLFNFMEDGAQRRQIMLCTISEDVDHMGKFLMDQDVMQLSKNDTDLSWDGLNIRIFNQGNPFATRKQVAPILLTYFDRES
jgi:exopolyphosphatase